MSRTVFVGMAEKVSYANLSDYQSTGLHIEKRNTFTKSFLENIH
jgi:hypothetical protein